MVNGEEPGRVLLVVICLREDTICWQLLSRDSVPEECNSRSMPLTDPHADDGLGPSPNRIRVLHCSYSTVAKHERVWRVQMMVVRLTDQELLNKSAVRTSKELSKSKCVSRV